MYAVNFELLEIGLNVFYSSYKNRKRMFKIKIIFEIKYLFFP